MQIGIFNYYQEFNTQNKIFDPNTYTIGENLGYPVMLLKAELNKIGIKIDTLDIHPIEKYDKILFLDFPNPKKISLNELRKIGKELYLIILESPIIKPNNWKKKNHKFFKKILTWNSEIVDGEKYIHMNLTNKISSDFDFAASKKNLCTLIVANKTSLNKKELYNERKKAIRWFEKNHPSEFDLYGMNWDQRIFKRPFSIFNRFDFFKKLFYQKYSSYQGPVKSKKVVLAQYKFCICYENAKNIPGYITEKIFDCFFAGCVPIYLGAPDIAEQIPVNTFIDKRDFKTYEALYAFISNMGDEEYLGYLKNIKAFLNSKKAYKFSAENFVDTIIKTLDLKKQ